MVPKGKVREVAVMLKAIHAQERREEALKKVESIANKIQNMKLKKAAAIVTDAIQETLEYMFFP
jgi:ribosomal protein L22